VRDLTSELTLPLSGRLGIHGHNRDCMAACPLEGLVSRSQYTKEALGNRSPAGDAFCSQWDLNTLTATAEGFSKASL
jgi:hypothetical protein